ncbi:MAG: murein L,D-transpeptidase catalytic domain family protein [Bacteroidota bacterium]|nr:murein L,D-transpeptidase catalytic domain family protein [Bacteroidota bacterium]
MYKSTLIIYFFLYIIISSASAKQSKIFFDTQHLSKNDLLFDSLRLGRLGLGHRAYDYAMLGYNVLKAKGKLPKTNILSIADMSLPSTKKRLFVIDVKNYKLLFVTYVAHGKNTGLDKSLYFSNEPESNKTSVGFYTTLGTYSGAHGYSLRLEGQEIGFNSNALERDIVVHSADYVDESVVKSQGYLGRSLGCPALSPEIYKQVIEKIKNGSCLFIYGNDASYITNSKLLKQKVTLEK